MYRRIGLLCLCTAFAASCSLFGPASSQRTELVFGTPCTVTIFERNARDALDAVFEEMHRIDTMMSTHRDTSAVSEVNASAGQTPVRVPRELYRVIEAGLAFSQITGGAFDISIGPLVSLWDIGGELPRVPSDNEIAEALELVDYRDIMLLDYQNQVLLKRRGMRLDLGAIAKGYAADRGAELLRNRGVKKALIDFGGNIYALGSKSDSEEWRIGIQNPVEPRGNFLGVLRVRDTSVVTSGTYERYFERDGIRYHHILDPDTGYPVNRGIASVTIIASSSMTADALATGVFVLGIAQGLTLVEAYEGVETVIVTDDRRVYQSSGAGAHFMLTDERFVTTKIEEDG